MTRAILDAMAGDLVTREHLDAKLTTTKTELLLAIFGVTGLILGSIYFVPPRLIHA